VLVANKNKLPKGNRKDSGKQKKCFRTHFSLSSAKEIQRERDGRASGRLQVSRLSSILLKSADEIQSCTAPNSKFTKNEAEYGLIKGYQRV